MAFGSRYSGINTLNPKPSPILKKSGDSLFWSGLMLVKKEFLKWMTFKVQNGKQTRFWED